jgi:hypothetical protein
MLYYLANDYGRPVYAWICDSVHTTTYMCNIMHVLCILMLYVYSIRGVVALRAENRMNFSWSSPGIYRLWLRRLSKTFEDFRRLSKTFEDFRRLSKTFEDFRRLSKTFEDFRRRLHAVHVCVKTSMSNVRQCIVCMSAGMYACMYVLKLTCMHICMYAAMRVQVSNEAMPE